MTIGNCYNKIPFHQFIACLGKFERQQVCGSMYGYGAVFLQINGKCVLCKKEIYKK